MKMVYRFHPERVVADSSGSSSARSSSLSSSAPMWPVTFDSREELFEIPKVRGLAAWPAKRRRFCRRRFICSSAFITF